MKKNGEVGGGCISSNPGGICKSGAQPYVFTVLLGVGGTTGDRLEVFLNVDVTTMKNERVGPLLISGAWMWCDILSAGSPLYPST